jgi:hypothetical protein
MVERLTYEDFADRVGEAFALTAADGDTLELELADVALLPQANRVPGGREPFSLLFHGSGERYAPQGTWRVEHDELGALEIFLVPLGPEDGVMRYQAVFA